MASLAPRQAATLAIDTAFGLPTPVSHAMSPISPVSDPTIRFTTAPKLIEDIYNTSGDFLIVTNVSPQDFVDIEKEREARRRKFRFRRYHPDRRILIIAIPTGAHEQLHCAMYQKINKRIESMGLEDHWTVKAATSFKAGEGGGNGEGDSTGGPRPQRSGPGGWPTLVIEAGFSESMAQLKLDMEWWFAASSGQVKIVILTKMYQSCGEIVIQRWEQGPTIARPGTTTTRASAAARTRPTLQQQITIQRDASRDPVTYHVVSDALILKFELLFLRAPGPGEGDIVLSIPDLQDFATRVWEEVA